MVVFFFIDIAPVSSFQYAVDGAFFQYVREPSLALLLFWDDF